MLVRNNGSGFNLHLGFVFNERGHLHGAHRNVIVADQFAKRAAHIPQRSDVFTLVGYIPGQPHEMFRASPCNGQHRDYVGQRLLCLRAKVAALEAALPVPAYLSCYEDLRTACGHTVRVSARLDPAIREQCFFHDRVSLISANAAGLKRASAAQMSSGISIDTPDSSDVVTSTCRA